MWCGSTIQEGVALALLVIHEFFLWPSCFCCVLPHKPPLREDRATLTILLVSLFLSDLSSSGANPPASCSVATLQPLGRCETLPRQLQGMASLPSSPAVARYGFSSVLFFLLSLLPTLRLLLFFSASTFYHLHLLAPYPSAFASSQHPLQHDSTHVVIAPPPLLSFMLDLVALVIGSFLFLWRLIGPLLVLLQ